MVALIAQTNKKETEEKNKPKKWKCLICEQEKSEKHYYSTHSKFFSNDGKLPYCKDCIENLYQDYYKVYDDMNHPNPEKRAVKRLCAAFDIFYTDENFVTTMKYIEKNNKATKSVIACYM